MKMRRRQEQEMEPEDLTSPALMLEESEPEEPEEKEAVEEEAKEEIPRTDADPVRM